MSTLSPWILTEAQKACIHVLQCDPSEDALGFPWTYTVDVGGFTYPARHTHPTRRAAWAAGKSYFKSLSESKGLRDGPMVEANLSDQGAGLPGSAELRCSTAGNLK